MPLSLWIQRLLHTSDWQRRERARTRRYNQEIELSVMRLEDRRVLNASGVFDLAAAVPGDSGGNGPGETQSVDAESSTQPEVTATRAAPMDIQFDGQLLLYRDGDEIFVQENTAEAELLGSFASLGSLSIQGGDGDDTLTVDFTNGNPVPNEGLFFDGLGQSEIGDALIVTGGDGFDRVVYDATDVGAGILSLDGSMIFFTGLEPIQVISDAGTVTINIDPDDNLSGTIHSELTAGPGLGENTISFDNGLESMTFSNPTDALVIHGDPNSEDVITLTSLDVNFAAAITVNGGDGDDTTNVNGLNADGSSDSPASLTINTESIHLNAASITTSGDQTYHGEVLLTGEVTLSGDDLVLDGGVTGNGNDLTLDFDGMVSQGAGITAPNLTLLGSGTFRLTSVNNDFHTLAASTTSAVIDVHDANDLTVGTIGYVTGITNLGNGNVTVTAAGTLTIQQPINNADGGNTTLNATSGDLVIHADLSNLSNQEGGSGSIVGRAGADVIIAVGTTIQTDTGFIQATTLNGGAVDPIVTLVPVDRGGSHLDSAGNASIEVTIPAPAGQNFEIVVDWGDGVTDVYRRPQVAPFDGSRVYIFDHTYTAHPDPVNPADPIPVSVTVAYDLRTRAIENGDNGIAFYRGGDTLISTTVSDELTVPGDGVFGFIIMVRNEIEPVQLRRVRSEVLIGNQASVVIGQDNWLSRESSAREFSTIQPARLFLRRVDSSGKEGDDVALDPSLLEGRLLPALSRLPNGRYRLYYQEPNSERVRMVREVNVYQGRVVPPDFRSDVSERQPGSAPAAWNEGDDCDSLDSEGSESDKSPSAAPAGSEGATLTPRLGCSVIDHQSRW